MLHPLTRQLSTIEIPTAKVFWMLSAYLGGARVQSVQRVQSVRGVQRVRRVPWVQGVQGGQSVQGGRAWAGVGGRT